MSDIADVSNSYKKYTQFTTKLKFYKDSKSKKRTVEKECTFELSYDYSKVVKIAEKYGDFIEGLKKLDESRAAILKGCPTRDALECIKFFTVTGDSTPLIGDDFDDITNDDIGTIEFEEIGKLLAAIYAAIEIALPKKKAMNLEKKEMETASK